MKKESKSIAGLKGQELNLENVKGGKQERSHDLLNVELSIDGDNIGPEKVGGTTLAEKRTADRK